MVTFSFSPRNVTYRYWHTIVFKPESPSFNGLDSILFPGIVLKFTVNETRATGGFDTLRSQLFELLKLWGLPLTSTNEKYMVAYVVPAASFVVFLSGTLNGFVASCDCGQVRRPGLRERLAFCEE